MFLRTLELGNENSDGIDGIVIQKKGDDPKSYEEELLGFEDR